MTNTTLKVFPNPVELGCTIEIQSEVFNEIEIAILGLEGTMIRNVFKGRLIPGSNAFAWDGKTEPGEPVRPGLYLLRFKDHSGINYFKILKTRL